MRVYSVAISESIRRSLRKLPKSLQERLLRAAYRLEQNPRPPGSTKLTGKPDSYRVRVGDYRIVYQIDDTRQWVEIAILPTVARSIATFNPSPHPDR